MSRPIWETPDGRRLYKAEVSTHHVVFERRNYKTRLETLYRNMGGLLLPMATHAHVELHRAVPPPPKPNDDLMRDIYHNSRLTGYGDVYELFKQIADYVGMVATTSQRQEHVDDAALLHENLVAQAAFIEQGRLIRVEELVA